MAEPIDLAARRLARPGDSRTLIDSLAEGATALSVEFASWPMRFVRESTLIGAERQLVELQRLLVELRAFVPATEASR